MEERQLDANQLKQERQADLKAVYSGKVPKYYLLKIIKEFLEWVDAVD